MSATWDPDQPGDPVTIGPVGWLLVALRGTALALLVFGGLALLLLVRLIERPLCGLHRPVTPYITQIVCRNAFRILGMGFRSYIDFGVREQDPRGAVKVKGEA